MKKRTYCFPRYTTKSSSRSLATDVAMLVVCLSSSILMCSCGSSNQTVPNSQSTDLALKNSTLFDYKDETNLFSEPAKDKKVPSKPTTATSGLICQDIEEGFGLSPSVNRQVYVHYTGYLQDGTKFDSSKDRGVPFIFKIGSGSVIPGFEQGLMGMKVGGTRRITIPPKLAYGTAGHKGKVPPNATLMYEVKLLCSDR